MKLAYSSNAYRRFPVDQAMQRIAGIGYAGFELMADEPHAWPATMTSASIDLLRNRIQQSRLEISNVNAFMMNAVQDLKLGSYNFLPLVSLRKCAASSALRKALW